MLDSLAHASVAGILTECLHETEAIFERQLASDFPAVNDLCRHVERYRGKMLRPTLVILCGLAASKAPNERASITERHCMVACVAEMIHMATLVHDDVLDEASTRRRGATVNSLRGNETAVMLGDYLISNAFHLCSRVGEPAINLQFGEVTNTLCEGELIQLHHRDDTSLDEPTYFEIIRRKTAVLVGACCRFGAALSGAPGTTVEALNRFGMAVGSAFQIQDDVLDLAGKEEVVGKSLGRDFAKGKMTLPLILLLAHGSSAERLCALDAIQAHDGRTLRDIAERSGALDMARERAVAIVRSAREELDVLAASPVRDLLHELAERTVSREF
ncbi:MAG: polyprenyl synthetase family protein [Phycisphaerae bacterium]|jgi:octaprenyl-diphosphate synthase|nr:polyprenyl synthetase family protein [Phycisphaerae bacterium]